MPLTDLNHIPLMPKLDRNIDHFRKNTQNKASQMLLFYTLKPHQRIDVLHHLTNYHNIF